MTVTRKILLPIIVVFALIVGILAALVLVYADSNLRSQEAANLALLHQSYLNKVEAQKQLALSLATQLADNSEIQAAFGQQDRQRLIDLALPAYEVLARQYGVSQAQFHLPPATSFLRLHQLDRFGDDLSSFRATVLAANQRREPVAGLEIGRGGIGVRGVVPVLYQGQHIGTVEYGLDPGQAALDQLKAQYQTDWQIMLSRQPAEIATFKPLNESLSIPSSDLVMQGSTLQKPIFADAAAYQEALNGREHMYYGQQNGLDYAILSVPLRDYSGQVIGVLDIIVSRAAALQAVVSQVTTAVAALVAVMVISSVAMALAVNRLMRPIRTLIETASTIAAGDVNRIAPVTSHDELGTLATAFNNMTGQMRDLINSLETRVELRTAELKASADVGRAATSRLNPDELLKETARLIVERFSFYYAAVFLVDETQQWAVLREADGPGDVAWVLKQAGHRLELNGQSMVSSAITSRQPAIALQVGASTVRFANPLLPDTRSEIALPLIVGDQVLGALDVQSAQPAAFDEANALVLQAMADQIAVALNNATQYRREVNRAQQFTGLLQAALELSSQPDRAQLLQRLAQVTLAVVDADGAGLWFPIDDTTLELEFSLNVGPIELTGRRLKIGEGLSGQVFASGLTLRVDDYLSWSGHSATFADAPFHSAVCTPLLWQGKVGGVLAVTRSQPNHPFTAEHENLLQIIATQAASALENLRLRAEQQRALDELTALNRQLVSEAWQAESLGEVVQYEYHQAAVDRARPLGLSLEIPIELRGTPIGTITLQDQTRRELSEDERGLIDGVVQQMALALENQRLATAAQLAAQRDRAIAETADKIHRPTDLEAILRVAVTELSRVTGISGIGVQLGFAPAVQGNGQHDEEAGAQAHD